MKKSCLPVLFLIIALLSCDKKSSTPEPQPEPVTGGLRSKFKDTLVTTAIANTNVLFASYNQLNGNFVVVQQASGSQYNLYKCDSDIKLLGSTTIDLGPDQLIEMEASKKEDAFFTLTSTNNFQFSNPSYINAYVIQNKYLDSTSNCTSKISSYYFENAFNVTPETKGNNHSTLNKFNNNGLVEWSKQLDGNYFDGNSLEADKDGNIFVLTANRFPVTPKLNTAFTTTLVPYYDFVDDSNSVSVYKFDKNGNQLFKKTIYTVKEISPFGFNPSLSLSNNYVIVSNTNNIYTLDVYGNLFSQTKPVTNNCYSYINSVITNPFINQTFVNGTINYVQNTSTFNYLSVTNNGSTHSTISQSANPNTKFIAADNSANIYCATQAITDLKKIDRYGNLIYNKGLIDGAVSFTVPKRSSVIDRNDALHIFRTYLNQILVYKFDNAGNYN